ncbi:MULTISPECIES: lipoprotein-releasing ABC transporter permease subunit [Pseudoalteromonas]|uniref:Cell division protein FtsX n=1 Tax=Pseudoalteromonas amylolytica TaxID=1859457 RepID=A0A1S1MQ95_9GAMM|nr:MULTISPECIES: lipoprotein-releasing ABC transporter permease subunit [Pseudoalteromonas]OHU86967.1 cell division protein FtsX [Pseudoalteromonas sp. JW3]OHU88324.1 cell division protein FtsX [Pseudoalteromonas amylolytica]
MFQPVSLFVGLRYATAAKGNAFISFISFFSIAGISLGLMSLITVSSVMNGFEQTLKTAMLDLIPHVQVKQTSASQFNSESLMAELMAKEQVKRVQPYLTSDVILQTNKELVGVRLQGVFDGYKNPVEHSVYSGTSQRLVSQKYQLMISRYLASKLSVGVGEEIRVIMPDVTSYTPLGRVPMQRLFSVAAIYDSNSEADTSLAFADGRSLARLMRRTDSAQYDVSITLDDAFSLTEFYEEMPNLQQQYVVDDWQSQQGTLFAAVAMEKRIMSLLLGLIVIVAIFNILSALSMMVREKQGEVAILQTLGFTPTMIGRVFMIQGLYNGLIGTGIGVFFGLLVANNINEILQFTGLSLLGGASLPVVFSTSSLLMMTLVSIALSFIATLYPAKKAASVLPAEVLRYE